MMYLGVDGDGPQAWSDVVFVAIFGFGSIVLVFTTVLLLVRWYVDYRKTKMISGHEEHYRKLVDRYEQLASSTMDAQQRAATELADLRTRMASVEQILRTVDGS
jgi:hypothetical protein